MLAELVLCLAEKNQLEQCAESADVKDTLLGLAVRCALNGAMRFVLS